MEADPVASIGRPTETRRKPSWRIICRETVMLIPVPNIAVDADGTPPQTLIDQAHDACSALDQAIRMLAKAAPHPDDYSAHGPDAYTQASQLCAQHIDTLCTIRHHYARLARELENN
jgi:hypothetical protein